MWFSYSAIMKQGSTLVPANGNQLKIINAIKNVNLNLKVILSLWFKLYYQFRIFYLKI
jgi:hypothetical protein